MNEKQKQVRDLEEIGRIRLSNNFFFRDFLHSEIATVLGLINVPDDVGQAVEAGKRLCEELLEPLHATFGKVCIRSGYRSREVNALGHRMRLGCASNSFNYAGHIWDARDTNGRMGATATIVIPWLVDRLNDGVNWQAMAWWVHDHLPYSYMCFYPKLAAFNLQWREEPERRILSWAHPKGVLTAPDMPDENNGPRSIYRDFPPLKSSQHPSGI